MFHLQTMCQIFLGFEVKSEEISDSFLAASAQLFFYALVLHKGGPPSRLSARVRLEFDNEEDMYCKWKQEDPQGRRWQLRWKTTGK